MTPGTDLNKLAYCGLYCGACPMYLATAAGTLEAMAGRGLAADHLRCLGCRSETVSVSCQNCAVKTCASGQGLVSCADCAEFPCRVLRSFDRDGAHQHQGVVNALQECRAVGPEEWLRTHAARHTCAGCGRKLSFLDQSCPACGRGWLSEVFD